MQSKCGLHRCLFQILHQYLCEPYNDVIHVSARGSQDTVHYVYSSYGLPSVLIARTDADSRLTFNCAAFHNQSTRLESACVSFSHEPDAVMVLVFSQVCLIFRMVARLGKKFQLGKFQQPLVTSLLLFDDLKLLAFIGLYIKDRNWATFASVEHMTFKKSGNSDFPQWHCVRGGRMFGKF